jgi:hypothetical protein
MAPAPADVMSFGLKRVSSGPERKEKTAETSWVAALGASLARLRAKG